MSITTLLLTGLAIMPQPQGRWIEAAHGEGPDRLDYRLYLPSAHGGGARLPLVVMLHGCTQTAADFAAGTRMAEIAESEGFLVAFPEQRPDANPQRCWNWYDPAHQGRDAGEPARIAGVVRDVLRDHAADPDRVYLAGISAGGAMSVNVAAAYPELFAAVAVHSGIGRGAAGSVPEALRVMREGPAGPGLSADALRGVGGAGRVVPLLVMHGAADPVVHPRNAEALARQWARALSGPGGEAAVAASGSEETAGGRAYSRTVLRRGPGGPLLVEWWSVQGLGHAWSGGDPAGSYTDPAGPDASREMARFFLAGTRPGEGR